VIITGASRFKDNENAELAFDGYENVGHAKQMTEVGLQEDV